MKTIAPKITHDEHGLMRFEYPAGFKGPFTANPLAESDADVLARVVAEVRVFFKDEDPATNPDFASFLRSLDRLDRLARSLRGSAEIRSRGTTTTAACIVGVAL